MFPNHSSRQGATPRPTRLPEVAEPSSCPEGCEPTTDADHLTDEAAFKVLLKRNLRPQAPPAELLGDIRTRIAKLRAD